MFNNKYKVIAFTLQSSAEQIIVYLLAYLFFIHRPALMGFSLRLAATALA
jgi:hypothetical protein